MLGDICSRLRGLDRFSTLRFPLEQVVLAAVYRLAHVVTVRPLAEHCDMSTGAVVSLTRAVWEAIVHVYWDEMVGGLRPTTETARMAAAAEFEEISGIPNCIGLCDGSGHHIVFPNVDDAAARESYRYFKTSKPQIRFFATCDAKRRIYDVFYGAPGRTSDAEMLGRTIMWQTRSSLCPEPYFFASDGGLAVRPQLMPPFANRDALSEGSAERQFNLRFSRMRVRIEQVFGILKARFATLAQTFQLESLETYECAFRTCVVLHNWCITNNLGLDEDDEERVEQLAERERSDLAARRSRDRSAVNWGASNASSSATFPDSHDGGTKRRARLMTEMRPPLCARGLQEQRFWKD
jgi:hypothetical protein